MAARKKKVAAPAGQLKQLRSTVKELRTRLEREAKRRRLDLRLLGEAKKARLRISKQVEELKKQGGKLVKQLRVALTDSKARDKARKDALDKVAALREELRRKTEELKGKSFELAKLAKESAERAREIITAPPLSPPAPGAQEPEFPPPSRPGPPSQ